MLFLILYIFLVKILILHKLIYALKSFALKYLFINFIINKTNNINNKNKYHF